MSTKITPEQNWQWRLALELTLRRIHGDALQDFFSVVMERKYGSDFVRVRPFGQRGDQGCDGYILSSGSLFQCYGKVDDARLNVATTVEKIKDDFAKAKANFGELMEEWRFVHNLLSGLASDILTTIAGLQKENPDCKIGIAGIEWFVETIFGLKEADIVDLLGPAATADLTHGFNIGEVRDLLAGIVEELGADPIDEGDPRPVPVDKLEFNKLSGHWRSFVRTGSANAVHAGRYIERHHNPEFGKAVAKSFKDKYATLKLQSLDPDAIMSELYHQTVGNGSISASRAVAAQAILAFFFDSCDIFEDRPVVAEVVG